MMSALATGLFVTLNHKLMKFRRKVALQVCQGEQRGHRWIIHQAEAELSEWQLLKEDFGQNQVAFG